jgi:hypothetical protein
VKINIEWQEPIQLTQYRAVIVDLTHLPDEIDNVAGVYFFSRKFGDKYEPFYIGQTLKMRQRLRQHLGTTALDHILTESTVARLHVKGGTRYFHYGYFKSKSTPERTKKCIRIAEKYLVRTALAKDFLLLNKHLTAFKTHKLTFSGSDAARAIYDEQATVEA